jgi:hypothetical protein
LSIGAGGEGDETGVGEGMPDEKHSNGFIIVQNLIY